MHEEGANLGGVGRWVEQRIFAASVLIASVERLTFAPAAAADDLLSVSGRHFRDEVGSVGDELTVYTVNAGKRAFDLRGGIIVRLKSAHRGLDDFAQSRNIAGLRFADPDAHAAPFYRRIPYNDYKECGGRMAPHEQPDPQS